MMLAKRLKRLATRSVVIAALGETMLAAARCACYGIILLCFALANAFADPIPGEGASDYGALVAAVKAGKTEVDYRALREAYARSPNYDPYEMKTAPMGREMFSAIDAGDCKKAVTLAENILELNFTYYDAHLTLSFCHKKQGSEDKAKREQEIAVGLMKSVLGSGDGKSPETAYAVVSIAEEYNVLRILKLRKLNQALVSHDSHSYDRFEAAPQNSETPVTLFFRIDGILEAASRKLHPN